MQFLGGDFSVIANPEHAEGRGNLLDKIVSLRKREAVAALVAMTITGYMVLLDCWIV